MHILGFISGEHFTSYTCKQVNQINSVYVAKLNTQHHKNNNKLLNTMLKYKYIYLLSDKYLMLCYHNAIMYVELNKY